MFVDCTPISPRKKNKCSGIKQSPSMNERKSMRYNRNIDTPNGTEEGAYLCCHIVNGVYIWQSMLSYAPLSIAIEGSALSWLGRVYSIIAKSTVIWAYIMWYETIAKRLDDSFFLTTSFFRSSFIFAFLYAYQHPQWMDYYCFFGFVYVSHSLFAYSFILLHCRFMLSVIAEIHFFHEAWNGGIQIKWFISVK